MTETAARARRVSALKGYSLLLAVLLGLGGCAGDAAPAGGSDSGYAQAPGVSFHMNAEMDAAVGAGTRR